jgi:hypothetical protein
VNGSWFNFYLCSAGGYLVLPGTAGDAGVNVPPFGAASGAEGCS